MINKAVRKHANLNFYKSVLVIYIYKNVPFATLVWVVVVVGAHRVAKPGRKAHPSQDMTLADGVLIPSFFSFLFLLKFHKKKKKKKTFSVLFLLYYICEKLKN